MPSYDFKTLSPIDFESLVRDLLQNRLQVSFESFKSGADKGIDLRYSITEKKNWIVQCKHYAESGFSALYQDLKKEYEKVKKLNPKKYFIATSVGLTPAQKEKIIKQFHPFIDKTADIYGKDDLNGLLSRFPDVEKHHFKLWITSATIFEEIFNAKLKNVSKQELETMHLHAKYYVQNDSYAKALSILEKYNFCILVGIPGVGKTILAEMLSLHYLREGYELVKICNDIREAYKLGQTDKKRIYYYDDFLGQTSLSDKLIKNEDDVLLKFFSELIKSDTSKLILTTREYILGQACLIYERLARTDLGLQKCVVDMSDYTRRHRAQILFNHLYFSNISWDYKLQLLETKNYLKIIDHRNYSPRIIDFLTQPLKLTNISVDKYMDYFEENLNNPMALWQHAFDNQISQAARDLLFVVLSMPAQFFLDDLREAFVPYHAALAKDYFYQTRPTDFENALKELEGNFLVSHQILGGDGSKKTKKLVAKFHSPSIRDFLKNQLVQRKTELKVLFSQAFYYEQISLLWDSKDGKNNTFDYREDICLIGNKLVEILAKAMSAKMASFIVVGYEDNIPVVEKSIASLERRAILVASVYSSTKNQKIKELLGDIFEHIADSIKCGVGNRYDLLRLLKELKKMKLDGLIDKDFIQKVNSFFSETACCPDDFYNFIEYYNLYSNIISKNDVSKVRRSFLKMLDAYEPLDDHSSSHEDLDQMKKVAKFFKIDSSGTILWLDGLVSELENEGYFEDGTLGYPDEHEKNEDSCCSDSEINSLFESLRVIK